MALALPVLLVLAPAAAHADRGDVCGALARQAERAQGIPEGLVHAVALAESGRWMPERRQSQPWPWTVTSGSESFFLPSKAAALAKVRELRAAGRTNIDVGCMQVNLGYHGDAFGSLAEALEPASNVAYAARLLKRLETETSSWAIATGRYHSSDPERSRDYRAKVYRLWQALLGEDTGPGRTAWPADAPVVLAGPSRVEQRTGTGNDGRLLEPRASWRTRPAARGTVSVLRGSRQVRTD